MIARPVVVALLLVGIALIAACQSTPDTADGGEAGPGGDPLLGTSWQLVSMEREGATFELPEGADQKLVRRMMPLSGFRGPEVVAATVAFLASDDAVHING